jgi:hypothetical protein
MLLLALGFSLGVVVLGEGLSNPLGLTLAIPVTVVLASPWWIPAAQRQCAAHLSADQQRVLAVAAIVLGVALILFGFATVYLAPPFVAAGIIVIVAGNRARRRAGAGA